MDISNTWIVVMVSWVHAYVKLIKLYLLKMCSFYINYTAIKIY